jgi:hypothetical protein
VSFRQTRPRRSIANADRDPDPHEPREIFRRRVGWVVRCPSCEAYFQSMRQWQFLCQICGHQWQQIAPRSRPQRFYDLLGDIGARIGMGLLWLFFLFALFLLWGLLIFGRFFAG